MSYNRLNDFTPREAITMLKDLQKGTMVKAFMGSWRKGTLHSIGRYGGSDVVYVQHDDNILPTMYYYSQLKIPRKATLI